MKLAIKEPCHEDWNNMKIGMISRHCGVCEKNVMDFTNSSRAEIITYILSNRNESTCGRMRRDQFEFHHEDIPVLVEVLKQQPRNHAFLILALVSLSLTACAQEGTNHNNQPTTINEVPIMGKIAPSKQDTIKPTCETPEQIKKGEIEILGEVYVEPTIQGGITAPDIERIESSVDNILPFAEKMPEYVTGIDGLFTYFKDYFKSKKLSVKGTAFVRFVVNEDGQISAPEIIKMDPQLESLSKEILQMLVKMPNWIPGENDGKKVKVYYTIPIRFE